MKQNPAQRRYVRRFIPTMLAYIPALFASILAIKAWHPTGALLVLLAILPAIPLIGVIAVLGLYVAEERDEYLRFRLVTAMLYGLGALLAAATIWGFLQLGGVIGPAPLYLAFPFWCAAFGIASGMLGIAERGRREP